MAEIERPETDRVRLKDIRGVRLVPRMRYTDRRGVLTTIATNLIPATDVTVVESMIPRTLRGLHYQIAPAEQVKLVSVIRGRIFDVVVDLRTEQPSYRRWTSTSLDTHTISAIYIPPGCAHGYLTLEPNTIVLYTTSARFIPQYERGVRWDDPVIGIQWPDPPHLISEKDLAWPLLDS